MWKFLYHSVSLILFLSFVTNGLDGPPQDPEERQETFADEDPIENANKDIESQVFEGDIVLTPKDNDVVDQSKTGDHINGVQEDLLKRSAIKDRRRLWPGGIVPYDITVLAKRDLAPLIRKAFAQFRKHTCIRFVVKKRGDGYRNWIRFVRRMKGCWSKVGRQYDTPGPQIVSIGKNCESAGIVMHELMHSIGFWHAQARYDRNNYVKVLWDNVQDGMEANFNLKKFDEVDALGASYDLDSLMHYRKYELSKNRKPTILSLINPNRPIGQRKGFSKIDALEINALYKCGGGRKMSRMVRRGSVWGPWSNFGPCNVNCQKFRERLCIVRNKLKCQGANAAGVQIHFMKCGAECNVPIKGSWGRWSTWTACSVPCGSGSRTRMRQCNSPAPRNGGDWCDGNFTEMEHCRLKPCPNLYSQMATWVKKKDVQQNKRKQSPPGHSQ